MHNRAISERDGVNIPQLAILHAKLVAVRRVGEVLEDAHDVDGPVGLVDDVPAVGVRGLGVVGRDARLAGVVGPAVARVHGALEAGAGRAPGHAVDGALDAPHVQVRVGRGLEGRARGAARSGDEAPALPRGPVERLRGVEEPRVRPRHEQVDEEAAHVRRVVPDLRADHVRRRRAGHVLGDDQLRVRCAVDLVGDGVAVVDHE